MTETNPTHGLVTRVLVDRPATEDELGQSRSVWPVRNARLLEKGRRRRGEYHVFAGPRVEERLDAVRVPCAQEAVPLAVPDEECKDASQVPEQVPPPPPVCGQNELGIASIRVAKPEPRSQLGSPVETTAEDRAYRAGDRRARDVIDDVVQPLDG